MHYNQSIRHTLTLDNLQVGYRHPGRGEQVVFGPLSLEVTAAEMIGIIGRNGIGKSTLLRTLAGLLPPLRGSLWMDGRNLVTIPPKELARLVSFVSTEVIGLQYLRVDELVALGRFPYTDWLGKLSTADHDYIQKAMILTGINHLMHKSMHELSDGERQKVMIARALAQDTPLIILDEPTAFLDLPARYEIFRILNDLTLQHHKTILFTTHDLTIALDVADKVWLMAEGLLHEGAPEDLLINGVIRKLFLNSPAEFDAKTASFRFRKECTKEMAIRGEKKYRVLTRKAMERIGFRDVDEGTPALQVVIDEQDDAPVWNLYHQHRTVAFRSIYTLAFHIKNIQS
jgi:iron complex transport system ATP-binding protein